LNSTEIKRKIERKLVGIEEIVEKGKQFVGKGETNLKCEEKGKILKIIYVLFDFSK